MGLKPSPAGNPQGSPSNQPNPGRSGLSRLAALIRRHPKTSIGVGLGGLGLAGLGGYAMGSGNDERR